jgi:hypothetical protein
MIKRMIKRQGAEIPGHPDHGDRWWSGHQTFHLVTAVDCHTAAMTTDLNKTSRSALLSRTGSMAPSP